MTAAAPVKVVPVAWRSLGVRWDNVEHFRVRWSDETVTDEWRHISEQAPYWHFGTSDRLQDPPPYDRALQHIGH